MDKLSCEKSVPLLDMMKPFNIFIRARKKLQISIRSHMGL